jgi:hypothetical protein
MLVIFWAGHLLVLTWFGYEFGCTLSVLAMGWAGYRLGCPWAGLAMV